MLARKRHFEMKRYIIQNNEIIEFYINSQQISRVDSLCFINYSFNSSIIAFTKTPYKILILKNKKIITKTLKLCLKKSSIDVANILLVQYILLLLSSLQPPLHDNNHTDRALKTSPWFSALISPKGSSVRNFEERDEARASQQGNAKSRRRRAVSLKAS